jgi:hypothetical protein
MSTGVTLANALISQTLQGFDAHGVLWDTFTLGGWGSPSSTLALVQKQRSPGAYTSSPQLAPRSLPIEGMVEAPDADGLRGALERLTMACDVNACTLTVTEGSSPRTLTCHRQDEVIWTPVTDTLANWSLAMVAPDPRKYGPALTGLTTGLPSSTGGLTFPATFPSSIDAVSSSGILHIDNPGTTPTPFVARIDGPVPGPRITHLGLGLTLALDYDLPADSWLVVDMERRRVLEGGTASRNAFVTDRGFFLLQPGANDLLFGADVINPDARLTLTAAPAYS